MAQLVKYLWQAWQAEFDPQNPQKGGRRGPSPQCSPLTTTHAPHTAQAPTHAFMHTQT